MAEHKGNRLRTWNPAENRTNTSTCRARKSSSADRGKARMRPLKDKLWVDKSKATIPPFKDKPAPRKGNNRMTLMPDSPSGCLRAR
jgi:hypothetical protein